ncbi:DUF6607 family protein [Muriicola sp.]|uniref:DUF6607 family protein n=2 Tax=Muriicola sp. TaxID=2020856 RepID=UPI00356592A3
MKIRKLTLFSLFAFVSLSTATGQDKQVLDRNAIKDMCGCYEISFQYSETFSPVEGYDKKPDYKTGALELALPIVDEDDQISIQHLLVVNDSTVIKHWRQDWLYENKRVFTYDKDNTWAFRTLPAEDVQGQWTQLVYQVDDSPRYSGTASWVHVDGKHFWENKTDSPLPRREYTKRDDYNVMLRGNRHEITAEGWIHEQDNDKIIRKDGEDDSLLAQEKGMNTYTRVSDEKCKVALDWWAGHEAFWGEVRAAWDEVYHREGTLSLARKVDDKPFYVYLKTLEEKGAQKDEILEVIQKFVKDDSDKPTEASR